MIITTMIFLVLCAHASEEPIVIPQIFKQSSPMLSPTEGSSGSSSHTTYVTNLMEKQDVYCISYLCDKTDFAKYKDIPIEYLIRNAGENAVKFEKLAIQLPDNIYIVNNTSSSNLDLELIQYKNKTIIFKNNVTGYSAVSKDPVFIDFKVRADKIGTFVIKPAIFTYSQNGIYQDIESDLIHINVLNNKPRIENMRLKENPGILGGNNTFSAEIEDSDIKDNISCTLWSTLDGNLSKNETKAKWISSNMFIYNCSLFNLKEGTHTLTLKAYDDDNDWAEDKIDLQVIKCYNIPILGNISKDIILNWGLWVFALLSWVFALLLVFINITPSLGQRLAGVLGKGNPDFKITAIPKEGFVNLGSEVQLLVNVEGVNGFNKKVKIEVETFKLNKIIITQSIIRKSEPSSINPSFDSIISIRVEPTASIGAYPIIIKGKEIGNNKEHSCNYSLTIF